mmetsp:Transcript_2923/g.8961  ORF Transcript_2923/g.8961 Transcript_2923/m.8961 type:complete len:299 (-) Transcript_2923:287-1183(-)
MGATNGVPARSSFVSRIISLRRDTGTHTSVVQIFESGFSAFALQNASFRTCHNSSRRCSSNPTFNSPPPHCFANFSTFFTCSATSSSDSPTNSIISSGFGCSTLPDALRIASIISSSSSSMRATATDDITVASTHLVASSIESKKQVAIALVRGMDFSFSVASVTTPRVPSEPMNRCVRSYPAELFLLLWRVFTISPFAKTTFKLRTFSRMLPCSTALVPAAPVPTIPPIEAPAPGSGGKNSPTSSSCSFNSLYEIPGCTVTSMSSTPRRSRFDIRDMFNVTPPRRARMCPSSEVPAP